MAKKTTHRDSWKSLKLWPHQEEAVKMVRLYLRSSSDKSALVSMPTGTGKSGAIAVLTRCFPDVRNSLVLAPWRALRSQLAGDIRQRFWRTVEADPERWPREVIELFPSNAAHEISKPYRTGVVFVSTIQAIQNIYSQRKKTYDEIARRVAFVVVDEGHREPAPEWAKAVRGFGKPTVLFTATPYRNDFKLFDVDPNHVYVYSHRDAVGQCYIRDVKFENRQFGNSTTSFVQALVDYYDGEFQKVKPSLEDPPRVIVRCDNNDEINDIASQLEAAGKEVIAIHERFRGEPKGLHRRVVPKDPRKRKEIFWVHQFKLIEGIDDPRFSLLAIYQPLRNARALVQQIGRIVRNPDRNADQTARVLCQRSDRQEAFWEGYKRYDLKYGEKQADVQVSRSGLFDKIIELHPDYRYVQGNYRKRFEFSTRNIYLDFRYSRSTSMYKTTKEFSLDAFGDALEKEWAERDLDIRHVDLVDRDTVVYVYVSYANSPLLLDSFLMEYRLGFTILHRAGTYLFFYDSQGNSWTELTKGLARIPPSDLEKLFADDTLRVSSVTLLNTDLGQHSVRSKRVSARSLSDTAPGLVDHAHFCTTVSGYTVTATKEIVRRYLGLSRGRITESSLLPLDYALYLDWLHSLVKLLDDQEREPVTLFERFARFAGEPPDPEAVNILFDLDDVENAFETSLKLQNAQPTPEDEASALAVRGPAVGNQKTRKLLILDDVCYGVRKNKRGSGGIFFCRANGERYEVSIKYDKVKKGYVLASPTLERAYVSRDAGGGPRENLVGYLNRSQSFRVIPRSQGFIYAHGHFYEPRLPLWGRVPSKRFDLLTVFRPIPELSSIKTEKGKCCRPNGKGWEEGSIFDLIDRLGEGTKIYDDLHEMNILICDDLGTEMADFIAADTNRRRVVFIHAKAVPTPAKRSATKLQDVSQQATKNLDPLQPFSVTDPDLDKWSRPWELEGVGKVDTRIRKADGTTDVGKLWNQIRDVIRDPSASREVWLVLGQMFSFNEFENQRGKEKPAPEIIQILYLVRSIWSSVSSVGASLRIYCSE